MNEPKPCPVPSRRSRKFLLTTFAAAVIAAGCSSSSTATSSPDQAEPDESGQVAASLCESTDNSPAFDPLASDSPWDLDGGVSTGNTDIEVTVTENARELLDGRVQNTVEGWNTNWDIATVDIGEIIGGGPPRDGIPPIDQPMFETVAQGCEWLAGNEPGALVQLDDEARFYPLSILTRHEIVNDRIGDVPVAVTFCPLCNTALAFDRRVDGEVRRFGVSGLLRNSDMVMWDDTTESMWQQITGEAIAGEAAGTRLEVLNTSIVSFEQFSASFPEGRSLSRETGFGIDYGANPYGGYSSSGRPFLFDGEIDQRIPALERVVAVTVGETSRAYPFSQLPQGTVLTDEIDDTSVVIWRSGNTADALDNGTIADSNSIGSAVVFSPVVDGQTLTFTANGDGTFSDSDGSTWDELGLAIDGPNKGIRLETVRHTNEFWFAWAAFFPDGELYEN